MKVNEILEGTRCWKGYEKKGMKTMFGKRVPNCVKREDIDPEGPEVTIGDYNTICYAIGREARIAGEVARTGRRGRSNADRGFCGCERHSNAQDS